MNVLEAAHVAADAQQSDDGELSEAGVEAFASIESYAEHVSDANASEDEEIAARNGRIDQLKARIADYVKLNASAENRKRRRCERLGTAMTIAGLTKLRTAFVSCFFRRTESIVVECDVAALPAEFVRVKTTTEPDKGKLKAHIAAGGSFPPGVRLAVSESVQVR